MLPRQGKRAKGGGGFRGAEREGEGERRPTSMALPSGCLQQCSSGMVVTSNCLYDSAYCVVVSEKQKNQSRHACRQDWKNQQ